MSWQHDEAMLELAALHGLGALPADEARIIEAHLRDCAECRREFSEAAGVAVALGASAAQAPPVPLRGRILDAAKSQPAQETFVVRAERKLAPFWQRWPVATATAVAALIAAVFSYQFFHHLPQPPPVSTGPIALHGPKAWPVACNPPQKRCGVSGRVIAAGPATLKLEARGFAPLPTGKVYQAWTIRPGIKKPVPQPTFNPDPEGRASVAIGAKPEKGLVVAVTVEPAGGSLAPTTTPFLIAALK